MNKNSFLQSLSIWIHNLLNLQGRTRRSDYWRIFALLYCIMQICNLLFCFFTKSAAVVLLLIDGLFLLFMLSITVRRLHDINKPGGYSVLLFVPVARLVLLVMLCGDSAPEENAYGSNPKLNIQKKFDFMYNSTQETVPACRVCGAELTEGESVCPACGSRIEVYYE